MSKKPTFFCWNIDMLMSCEQTTYIFLLKYLYFDVMWAKNIHFSSEILICWRHVSKKPTFFCWNIDILMSCEQKTYIFLLKYWYVDVMWANNLHFSVEILIFWCHMIKKPTFFCWYLDVMWAKNLHFYVEILIFWCHVSKKTTFFCWNINILWSREQKTYIFLMKYVNFIATWSKNMHFSVEMLIFWCHVSEKPTFFCWNINILTSRDQKTYIFLLKY